MARSRVSETRRRNRSSDTPPRHLGALPKWNEIELRLHYGWTPHEVVVWHREQHPGSPQPTVRALEGFLRHKPMSWFVGELAIASFAPPRMPRIFVLREQAALIEIQKFRLNKLLAMEHDSGDHTPEVRHNIELLLKMYDSHFTAQQAAGVEPAYLRAQRPTPERSDKIFRHPTYPFLTSDEARRLVQLEQQVDSGELDPIELYRLAAPMFEAEQRPARERGPR